MKYLKIIIKELKRKMTIVFVHHGRLKPVKFNFSLSIVLLIMFSWTSLTLWAGFLSGQHIDYLKIKADHKIMQIRMLFFADQMRKSKEMLSQIKQNDDHIRSLLAMNSKRIIIEDGLGAGGPTPMESSALSMLLMGNDSLSYQDISKQSFDLLEEYKASMKSYSEVVEHIKKQRITFRYTPSMWPTQGIITSPFGLRIHPFFRTTYFHPALDIANNKGTPIYATADGKVAIATWQSGYGYVIVIEHGRNYRTFYAHLSKILVKRGDTIIKGQEIAKMGNTGRSTGSHLHYEIHYNGRPVNPIQYLSSYLE